LLQSEVDKIELMTEAMMDNDICKDLIKPLLGDVIYEEPATVELFGNMWKGKADIINHEEKLVIDLKTTNDIDKFRWSASKYNYDSQAYIYKQLFGYDMVFVVIDKISHQLGLFECSEEFYTTGEQKVTEAVEIYKKFWKDPDFKPDQYYSTEVL
jgi:hypothetical protein